MSFLKTTQSKLLWGPSRGGKEWWHKHWSQKERFSFTSDPRGKSPGGQVSRPSPCFPDFLWFANFPFIITRKKSQRPRPLVVAAGLLCGPLNSVGDTSCLRTWPQSHCHLSKADHVPPQVGLPSAVAEVGRSGEVQGRLSQKILSVLLFGSWYKFLSSLKEFQ